MEALVDPRSDTELIAVARSGDREAFGVPAKRHESMAHRLALGIILEQIRLCGPAEVACILRAILQPEIHIVRPPVSCLVRPQPRVQSNDNRTETILICHLIIEPGVEGRPPFSSSLSLIW